MGSSQLKGRAAAVAVMVAIASVGAGVAWGAIPEADGTINACYKSDGTLRVIDTAKGQQCKSSEAPISWKSGASSVALEDGSVAESKIADGAVTEPKIAANAVTTGKIADGTITDVDIASVSGSKIAGALAATVTVAASQIGNGLTGTQILDGTITAADLAGNDTVGSEVAGAVTSEKIFDGTIETRDLRNNSVTSEKLAAGSVRGGEDGAVANNIDDGSVTGADIANGAVSNAQLASPLVSTTTGVALDVSIPGGEREAVLLSVSGVTPGDAVNVAPPALQGTLLFGGAAITSPGVVTVYIYNPNLTTQDVTVNDMFEVFTTDLTPSP